MSEKLFLKLIDIIREVFYPVKFGSELSLLEKQIPVAKTNQTTQNRKSLVEMKNADNSYNVLDIRGMRFICF